MPTPPGAVVAQGTGTGTAVDWTWDAIGGAAADRYTWTIATPGARSATGTLGAGSTALARAEGRGDAALVAGRRPGRDTTTIAYTLTAPATVTATLVDAERAGALDALHGAEARRARRRSPSRRRRGS